MALSCSLLHFDLVKAKGHGRSLVAIIRKHSKQASSTATELVNLIVVYRYVDAPF